MGESGFPSLCSICFLEIEAKGIIEVQCGSNFHKNHLAAWFLTSAICPVCRLSVDNDLRMKLYPKTQEERRELEGLRYEFSNLFQKAGKTDSEAWENKRKTMQTWLFVFSVLLSLFILFLPILTLDTPESFFYQFGFEIISAIWFSIFIFFMLHFVTNYARQEKYADWKDNPILQLFMAFLPIIILLFILD